MCIDISGVGQGLQGLTRVYMHIHIHMYILIYTFVYSHAHNAHAYQVLDKHRKDVHGIIHCSGGAQTKALHFIENVHVIKDNLFPVPPLFDMIHKESGTDWKEVIHICIYVYIMYVCILCMYVCMYLSMI